MEINFPGGLAVRAAFGRFEVITDQSPDHGGAGAAPEPFQLFLASIGTCAGLYALRFCQERSIPTEGLGLTLTTEPDLDRKRIAAIRLEIRLPEGFPEKYRAAIVRAADQCTVKRHILEPPHFEVTALTPEPALTC
jgi:putative redox protein